MAKPALAARAAAEGNFSALSLALAGRGSKQAASQRDSLGRSLFISAIASSARDGDAARCIALLAAHGADPSAPDFKGQLPIHFAAKFNRPDCVRALASLGADLDAPLAHASRSRPIHFSAHGASADTLGALADCGADLFATDANGDTALECSARLLSGNADPKAAQRHQAFHDALLALTERAAIDKHVAAPARAAAKRFL